jgi:uncharacterized repeat protein (TIGR03803 family)
VLYNFDREDGANPQGGVLIDKDGVLYGTAEYGGGSPLCGSPGCGVVFALRPPAKGQKNWTFEAIHRFHGYDGAFPVAGPIMDSDGVLYGTVSYGGGSTVCYAGCGAVFELKPPAPDKTAWKESTLLDFDGTNGAEPRSALTADNTGTFYGTTYSGGSHGSGVVYELKLAGKTAWKNTLIYSFAGGISNPSGVTMDQSGALIGTTYLGGPHREGTVFQLSPTATGAWAETMILGFDGAGGAYPAASLLMDTAGTLFGTTSSGGSPVLGTVYGLMPPTSGKKSWTETVLYVFRRENGVAPVADLVMDKTGALFGTASGGGSSACSGGCGVVFELAPPTD